MVEAPLSERLEYAILEIVCNNPAQATHQDSWGGWSASIRHRVPAFADADLLAGFRRLWKRGVLRLTKPDTQRRHALDHSSNEQDDAGIFFTGAVNRNINSDESR